MDVVAENNSATLQKQIKEESTPVNVLILCTSDGKGGLELNAGRQALFISKKTSFNCFFTVHTDGYLADYAEKKGIRVNYLHWEFRPLPVHSARKLARFIDEHQIDIVHFHWGKDLALAVLAKLFSKRTPKLLYTRHMGITRPKTSFYHRFLYKNVDQVLAVSELVHKEAVRFLPINYNKIKRHYSGVPAPKPDSQSEANKGLAKELKKEGFNIGMFGRIEHGKGQHILIDAIKALTDRGLNINATFIGHVMDDEYYNNLTKTIEENHLEDRIRFIGFVENPMEIMPCFDVITLLTYCETFGLVLVEAMRMGVAVVGTNAGGVPEIIQHNESGMLIPPGDPLALAETIEQLYEDDELRVSLAQNGKIRADAIFDEETNFSSLMELLRELKDNQSS